MHGSAIVKWIQDTTDDALCVEEGSLYPALHRLEEKGFIDAKMRTVGEQATGQPAYTLAVAVTMALGIGANTAVFSVVYGVPRVQIRCAPFEKARLRGERPLYKESLNS
jgi:hypothetical protein